MLSKQPKIALVHDDFAQSGGAENLFAEIAQIYPNAPIYTALVNWNKLPVPISQNRVRPSFMQKIPFASKFFKLLLPLYPLAFESFDFSPFDLVISSTTRFSKGIITKPKTLHICYINTTPRFLWHEKSQSQYLKPWQEKLLKPVFYHLRHWDKAASARPDFYIANSRNVAQRVKKDYGRDANVVYPYADTEFFQPAKIHNWELKSKNYYLVVSRLIKWKRVDLAVKACAAFNKNLIIVGTGPDEKRLKHISSSVIPSPSKGGSSLGGKEGILRIAKKDQILDPVENDNFQSSITFLGSVSPETLRELYQNAKGLIVTQEEDFGISIVEAQACGIPVIAYAKGGQSEIIVEGKTGLFFNSQSQKSLEDAILDSSKVKWDVSACRKNSLCFSKEVFVKGFNRAIADKTKVS